MTRLKNCELRRSAPKVYDFCHRNAWEIIKTKKCHFSLRHPVAGIVVHGSTSSDKMAEMACITRLRRYMRQANLEVKE